MKKQVVWYPDFFHIDHILFLDHILRMYTIRKIVFFLFMYRAPFYVYFHATWFTQAHNKQGFISFLDKIVTMKDVWIVTNWQAIQWIKSPTPLSRIDNFAPFGCNYQVKNFSYLFSDIRIATKFRFKNSLTFPEFSLTNFLFSLNVIGDLKMSRDTSGPYAS